ncbi:hypothetical protein [Deinococcus roseus]|uniref:hypothetical protein n=1 Tax=Deinococcus roseus TaxID=392414 RepID=UPI00166B6201|nr:hypothetical protein [Deinococcus roseus]
MTPEESLNLYLNLFRFYVADRQRHHPRDTHVLYLQGQLRDLRKLVKKSTQLDPLSACAAQIYRSEREALEAEQWLKEQMQHLSRELTELRQKTPLSEHKKTAGIQLRITAMGVYKEELHIIQGLGHTSLAVKVRLQNA